MFRKLRKLQRQDGDSVSADTPGAVATSLSPSAAAPPHQEPATAQNDDSPQQTTGSPAPANPSSSSPSSSLPPPSPPQSSQHVPLKSSLNLDTASIKSASTLPQRVGKKLSWYGSLPHKATAASSVTHETILGDTFQPPTATTTANISRLDRTIKRATSTQSLRPSSKGIMPANLPSGQTTNPLTNENPGSTDASLTSGSTSTETSPVARSQMELVTSEEHGKTEGVQRSKASDGPGPAKQIDEVAGAGADATDRGGAAGDERAAPAEVGWFGWLWGQMVDEASSSGDQSNQAPKQGDAMEADELEAPATQAESPFTESVNPELQAWMSYASWLGSFWYGTKTTESTPQDPAGKKQAVCNETSPGAAEAEMSSGVLPTTTSTTATNMGKMPLSNSTWAFWLRQPKEDNEGQKKVDDGELAVMGEASEDAPTTVGDIEALKNAKEKLSPAASIVKAKKRQCTSDPDIPASSFPKNSSTASLTSESSDMTTSVNPNLLLPSFISTYKPEPTHSLVSQITNLILRPASANSAPPRHVFRTAAPPERPIKKAISIGVHGLFPAAYLRPMVGQPTGTSLRFANLGAEAISRWTGSHGFGDCVINKVALESKGKIMERVDNLWKLLLNWLDELKEADLILVSCHSQGVPVGIMLVAKLLGLGVIGDGTRIGICAMAGVCGGPFPDYKASIGMLMGSAAELWEFSRPDSAISGYLEHSLKVILHWGVRVTFVGSMDDQVVPMESAVFSSAHHPYIYRAVFIDGRLHTPDFIANLVGFALKLRNLGVPDHGLIRELSIPLAGSLYSGEGHSRLYYDDRVYDLALANTLETTRVPGKGVECVMGKREGLAEGNPYVLPWVLRGVLEEGGRDAEMKKEVERLVELFESWRPGTKALRDVKYRLEAVRSRL